MNAPKKKWFGKEKGPAINRLGNGETFDTDTGHFSFLNRLWTYFASVGQSSGDYCESFFCNSLLTKRFIWCDCWGKYSAAEAPGSPAGLSAELMRAAEPALTEGLRLRGCRDTKRKENLFREHISTARLCKVLYKKTLKESWKTYFWRSFLEQTECCFSICVSGDRSWPLPDNLWAFKFCCFKWSPI